MLLLLLLLLSPPARYEELQRCAGVQGGEQAGGGGALARDVTAHGILQGSTGAPAVHSLLEEFESTWKLAGNVRALDVARSAASIPTSRGGNSAGASKMLSASVPVLPVQGGGEDDPSVPSKSEETGPSDIRVSSPSVSSSLTSSELVSGSVQTLPTILERSESARSSSPTSMSGSLDGGSTGMESSGPRPTTRSAEASSSSMSSQLRDSALSLSESLEASPPKEVSMILERYSDMLVGMVQSKLLGAIKPGMPREDGDTAGR